MPNSEPIEILWSIHGSSKDRSRRLVVDLTDFAECQTKRDIEKVLTQVLAYEIESLKWSCDLDPHITEIDNALFELRTQEVAA